MKMTSYIGMVLCIIAANMIYAVLSGLPVAEVIERTFFMVLGGTIAIFWT